METCRAQRVQLMEPSTVPGQWPGEAREESLSGLLVPVLLPCLYVNVQPGHLFLVKASYSISSSAPNSFYPRDCPMGLPVGAHVIAPGGPRDFTWGPT